MYVNLNQEGVLAVKTVGASKKIPWSRSKYQRICLKQEKGLLGVSLWGEIQSFSLRIHLTLSGLE